MYQARHRLQATMEHVATLRAVVLLLVVLLIALWWRNGQLQETRRLYIPPDLTQGLVTDFQHVPAPTVYTFAYYIFQQLHRWKTDGEKDYPQQIYTLQGFLTPACIAVLKADMNAKKRRGELRQRVRSVEEVLGQAYQRSRVLTETPNAWTLWLDLRVHESINGHPVKDVSLRYRLRVVRFDVDKAVNPWGLALSCDEGLQPMVLTPEDIDQPFQQPGDKT